MYIWEWMIIVCRFVSDTNFSSSQIHMIYVLFSLHGNSWSLKEYEGVWEREREGACAAKERRNISAMQWLLA